MTTAFDRVTTEGCLSDRFEARSDVVTVFEVFDINPVSCFIN